MAHFGTVDWTTFSYRPSGEPNETTRGVLFAVDEQYALLRQRLELVIVDSSTVCLSSITGLALRDAMTLLSSFFNHVLPIADGFLREFCLVVRTSNKTIQLVLFHGTRCFIDSTYSQAFSEGGEYFSITSFPDRVSEVLDAVYAMDRDLRIVYMPGTCFICSMTIAGQCVRLSCGHVVHRLCHFETMRHEGTYGMRFLRDANGRWQRGNLGHDITCGICTPLRVKHGRVSSTSGYSNGRDRGATV